MKKSVLFLMAVLTVVSIGFPGQSVAAEQKHFRHLMFRESPLASYRGIHPVSKQQSQSVAHYEFSYDDQGRVKQISRKINDTLIGGMGVFDSFIWFAPQVRIAYQANREVHTYYGPKGEQISAHGKVWRAEYKLDESGNRQSLVFFDAQGKPTESEWNIHQYQWRASHDGHTFEKRLNLKGEQMALRPEFKFYEVKLEYDNEGKLVFMRNFGINHQLTNNDSGAGIDRITYDLSGNFIRWQVYDKDGNAVEGNRPMVHLGEHLYDSFGNKIGMRGFDRHGKNMPFSWGSIKQLRSFNKQGIQDSYTAFNADGSFDVHLKWQYNERGTQQTSLTSFDESGKKSPSPHLRGAAQITFHNDNGETERKFYDVQGKQMQIAE